MQLRTDAEALYCAWNRQEYSGKCMHIGHGNYRGGGHLGHTVTCSSVSWLSVLYAPLFSFKSLTSIGEVQFLQCAPLFSSKSLTSISYISKRDLATDPGMVVHPSQCYIGPKVTFPNGTLPLTQAWWSTRHSVT